MSIKHLTEILIVISAGLAITWGISHIGALSSFEDQTIDIRQISFPPKTAPNPDIVMVWLDELTMKSLPFRSPVPRDFLAALNDRIFAAGAKMVGYDIFFKGSSFPEADASLAASLAGTNAYAVVPMRPKSFCSQQEDEGRRTKDEGRFVSRPSSLVLHEDIAGCVEMPDEIFAKALKGTGLADLPFSAFDTTVRNAKFIFNTDIGSTESMAAMLYRHASGKDALATAEDRSHWPKIGPISFTPFLDDAERTRIRFVGPPSRVGDQNNAFKVYSAKLVAGGLIPAAWLQGKIVLVGAAYDDATDAYLTPYYRGFTSYARMNGVEIHANILSSLLERQFFYNLYPWQKWTLIIAMIVIMGSTSLRLVPLKSFFIFIAALLAEVIVAVQAFKVAAVIVPVVLPAAGAVASYAIGIGVRALTEGRQKRFIKGVFARYVPPAVVERMTEHPEMLRLGGEERSVTSMFTDIASFTSISEKMDPTTLVSFLNDYLGRMNEVLFKYGATLDKYEGDAIIAFFNAPLDVLQHEMAAVRAAIEMRSVGEDVTRIWRDRCGRDVVTRVGINTGMAVVGNMGSEGRFDYTAIGDTINLASRLEGTNKFYGTVIMASEMTAKALDDSIILRPVDRVRVKGKREAILLYEVVALASSPYDKNLVDRYNDAFKLFEENNTELAIDILDGLLKLHPDDGPSKELLGRCRKSKAEPDWDRVTNLMAK